MPTVATTPPATPLVTPLITPFRLNLATLSAERLLRMQQGGEMMLDAILALQKRGHSVLSRVGPRNGQFNLWDHYPPNEVSDSRHASQYYYHSHRTSKTEHGHFHLFALLCADGSLREPDMAWQDDEAPSHLIALALNPQGLPIKLFCTNQWVTKGYWFPADQVLARLDQFTLQSSRHWALVSRWLMGFVQLFWPQIEAVLHARDVRVAQLRGAREWLDFAADESIEVINTVKLDLHRQIGMIDAFLERQASPRGRLLS
jgi:hypothetical protein